MPGTENPNLPTYGLSEAAVEERQPEVPNASFEGGGNEAASNSPGIGINTGDYNPKSSDWSREERTPQQFGHIGLSPLGDVRVDNPIPGDLAYFVQAGGVTAPDAQIPGTGAFNRTGITVPSGAWLWGSSPGFAPESLALFAAMTPEPNDEQKLAIDNFMRDGLLPIWDKEDAFYVLHSYASQPSLLNWKNPAESAIPVNSPTFIPYSGWQGDGVAAYISIPTALSAFTQNNAHYSSSQALVVPGSANNVRVGDSTDTVAGRRVFYSPRNLTNQRNCSINNEPLSGNMNPSIDGRLLTTVNRTSSLNISIYDGGEFSLSQAQASSDLPTLPLLLMRARTVYGDMRINFFDFGASLSAAEIGRLNTAWAAYKSEMVTP